MSLRNAAHLVVARVLYRRPYGGYLSVVGRPQRDGSTMCARCESTGFTPLGFSRFVGCAECPEVYSMRPTKMFHSEIGNAVSEFVSHVSTKRTK